MIFGQDRNELRQMYIDAWAKSTAGDILSPLEAQIVAVINDHPEYQSALTAENLDKSFSPESGQTNPFLHMGLHLAIREQVATDRPTGIKSLFAELRTRLGDHHAAEHLALECLAETLWEAQSNNAMPDEAAYLQRLQRL
ncbi:MAG: DUF1841 family protein [Woeseiaceae bacterium]